MKKELSKEDSETYLKIVQLGNMDDMFDFGYICGKIDSTDEALELLRKNLSDSNQPK